MTKPRSTESPFVAAVICAGGSSSRMGGGVKKEYRLLDAHDMDGHPLTVLGASLIAFATSPRVSLIVITVPSDPENGEIRARAALPPRFQTGFLADSATASGILFVPGGRTRRISVHHALSLLAAYSPDYVLIHDGARPWVDAALIERTIDAAVQYKAVVPILPLVETPKEIDENGFVVRHLHRARTAAAQTPQGFAFPEILRAHEQAAERELQDRRDYTDDAEIWGEFCGSVAVIPGSPANKKITVPADFL